MADEAADVSNRYAGALTLIQFNISFPNLFYYWTNLFWWKLVTRIAGSTPVITITLACNFANLTSKDYIKYLGVMIDKNISWKFHIDVVATKFSKIVGLIMQNYATLHHGVCS